MGIVIFMIHPKKRRAEAAHRQEVKTSVFDSVLRIHPTSGGRSADLITNDFY
jgi:hypothetical protein